MLQYTIIYETLMKFSERGLTSMIKRGILATQRNATQRNATQRNATQRANCVLLSYPKINKGYNARDHCISDTVGYGRFCIKLIKDNDNEKNKTQNTKRVPVVVHDYFVHGGNERDGERG